MKVTASKLSQSSSSKIQKPNSVLNKAGVSVHTHHTEKFPVNTLQRASKRYRMTGVGEWREEGKMLFSYPNEVTW